MNDEWTDDCFVMNVEEAFVCDVRFKFIVDKNQWNYHFYNFCRVLLILFKTYYDIRKHRNKWTVIISVDNSIITISMFQLISMKILISIKAKFAWIKILNNFLEVENVASTFYVWTFEMLGFSSTKIGTASNRLAIVKHITHNKEKL